MRPEDHSTTRRARPARGHQICRDMAESAIGSLDTGGRIGTEATEALYRFYTRKGGLWIGAILGCDAGLDRPKRFVPTTPPWSRPSRPAAVSDIYSCQLRSASHDYLSLPPSVQSGSATHTLHSRGM
jgi:hypothetical protein